MPYQKPVRWLPEAASQFSDPVMVADYVARDPFNPQVVPILKALSGGRKPILDVGCGCAQLTFLLAQVASKVDAIDPSEPMLNMAVANQPPTTTKKIRWIHGTVEDNPDQLARSYGLVTAADSIHWTDWARFFPTIRDRMMPGAYLVVVERFKGPALWKAQERSIISHYYTEKDQGQYDPVEEIVARRYFRVDGQHITPPLLIAKSPADYLRERHSRNGCSRTRMGRNVRSFDREMIRLLETVVGADGLLHYESYTKLRWGIVT